MWVYKYACAKQEGSRCVLADQALQQGGGVRACAYFGLQPTCFSPPFSPKFCALPFPWCVSQGKVQQVRNLEGQVVVFQQKLSSLVAALRKLEAGRQGPGVRKQ